jgi:predicted transcriptional regulator
MAATKPPNELRLVAKQLIAKQLESMSVVQAARDLRVSRQAIYGFKSGDFCPSIAVIQRACEKWELEFTVAGMKISASSFKPDQPRIEASSEGIPFQPTLFDLWSELHNQRMTVVRAVKVDGAVEMTLRISIPA